MTRYVDLDAGGTAVDGYEGRVLVVAKSLGPWRLLSLRRAATTPRG